MKLTIFDGNVNYFLWDPILPHFRPPGPLANYRYGHSESNALIGIEFGEFRQKLKKLEFRQNLIFWESMGAIWIGSISFGVVPPLSTFFIFFQFLWNCQFLMEIWIIFCEIVNFWWRCELFFVKLSIVDGNVNYFLWNCQLLMEMWIIFWEIDNFWWKCKLFFGK